MAENPKNLLNNESDRILFSDLTRDLDNSYLDNTFQMNDFNEEQQMHAQERMDELLNNRDQMLYENMQEQPLIRRNTVNDLYHNTTNAVSGTFRDLSRGNVSMNTFTRENRLMYLILFVVIIVLIVKLII